jgi:ABC-type nitrate/sulfonate/bicarbonate transport system substrate-binding protein
VNITKTRKAAVLASVVLLGLGLSACSAPAPSGDDSSTSLEKTEVKFALGYLPGAGDVGVYVALAEGFYEDAGLDVEILPFGQTSGLTLVAAGTADFTDPGLGDVAIAAAAGQPVTSVAAIAQHNEIVIAALASNTAIKTPADLDGKLFGNFGVPIEDAINTTVITNDGGTGEVERIVLGPDAASSVYSGAVDFAQLFLTNDVVQAELSGEDLTLFDPVDYGYPDNYGHVLAANNAFIDANPNTTAAFTEATIKGYAFAQENPDEAAQIIVDANPDLDITFIKAAVAAFASLLLDADGTVGPQDGAIWDGYVKFMFDNALLADANGAPLTVAPDAASMWTDEFLETK